jgi:hypothetical protein
MLPEPSSVARELCGQLATGGPAPVEVVNLSCLDLTAAYLLRFVSGHDFSRADIFPPAAEAGAAKEHTFGTTEVMP